MGHLSISMCLKIHFNLNTFTSFYFSNFKIFDEKKNEFKLMTYRCIENALSFCTKLLGNSLRKDKNNEIIHDFIVYFISLMEITHTNLNLISKRTSSFFYI